VKWLVPLLAAGVLLYVARAVLPPFIVAGVLAYIFSPLVDELERRSRARRIAVVGGIYVVLLGLLGFGIWVLETRLVSEMRALSAAGPDLVDIAFQRLLGTERFDFLGQTLDPHAMALWTNRTLSESLGPADAFHVAERAVDTLLKVILTLLVLFYLLLDGRKIWPVVLRFVAPPHRAHVREVALRIHLVLARYLRGQLYLVCLMSTVTFLMLEFVFHLPYALPVGLATGVLEVVPLLGPWLAGAIAAIIALVHYGPAVMLWVAVAYFVLRMLEDQLVMPIVVGRAVHLHPLVTIFAVLVGGSIGGVLGVIMAVPLAAAVRVTLDYAFPEPSMEPVPAASPEIDSLAAASTPDQEREEPLPPGVVPRPSPDLGEGIGSG
jgi:predicted PurR-regulated permease PerM